MTNIAITLTHNLILKNPMNLQCLSWFVLLLQFMTWSITKQSTQKLLLHLFYKFLWLSLTNLKKLTGFNPITHSYPPPFRHSKKMKLFFKSRTLKGIVPLEKDSSSLASNGSLSMTTNQKSYFSVEVHSMIKQNPNFEFIQFLWDFFSSKSATHVEYNC